MKRFITALIVFATLAGSSALVQAHGRRGARGSYYVPAAQGQFFHPAYYRQHLRRHYIPVSYQDSCGAGCYSSCGSGVNYGSYYQDSYNQGYSYPAATSIYVGY